MICYEQCENHKTPTVIVNHFYFQHTALLKLTIYVEGGECER